MDKEKLFEVLGIAATHDIKIIYSAAKKYARTIHPDFYPEKMNDWLEFEPAYNEIKRLSVSKLPFEDFKSVISRPVEEPYDPSSDLENWETVKTEDLKPKQDFDNDYSKPTKGQNITIREVITFDQIVYGCQILVAIPQGATARGTTEQPNLLSITVTPTPIWTNQNGSISKKAINAVLAKKITIYGGGFHGSNGGPSGNLIIEFDVDMSRSNAIRQAIDQHFSFGSSRYLPPGFESYFPNVDDKTQGRNDFDLSSNQPPLNDSFSGVTFDGKRKNNRLKGFAILAILLAVLCYRLNAQSQRQNQEQIAWDTCEYIRGISQDVSDYYFYNYEKPWEAALYYGYFNPDPNAPDQTSYEASANELPSIYIEKVLALKSPIYLSLQANYLEFESKLANKDKTYGVFADRITRDCKKLERNGGFGF